MSAETLKKRIAKSLDKMNEIHLQHAYEVLKQIVRQQKYSDIKVDNLFINARIDNGITELDNSEGTDFRLFLNEMQEKYEKRNNPKPILISPQAKNRNQ